MLAAIAALPLLVLFVLAFFYVVFLVLLGWSVFTCAAFLLERWRVAKMYGVPFLFRSRR